MAAPASLLRLPMWQWAKVTEVSGARAAAAMVEMSVAAIGVAVMVVVEREGAAIGVAMTVGAARERAA